MSTSADVAGEHETETGRSWWQAGALGGVVGAVGFGLLLMVIAPDFLAAMVPALYGVEPITAVGWLAHLAHGLILGVVFGALVEREVVMMHIRGDVETDALDETGPMLRTIGAGVVYGLAVWAILPVLVMPAWLGAVGFAGAPTMPAVAIETLAGHLLYGLLLGAVYAVTAGRR